MKHRSPKYVLEESLSHLAARFYRVIMKRINRGLLQQGLRVTLEQWPVLIYVWDHNGISQNELSRKLFKDKTTIARLVAGIESAGMIERISSEHDRRGKNIFLTKKGTEIMDKATKMVRSIDESLLAGVDVKDLEICKDVLRRAHKNIMSNESMEQTDV